MKGMRALVWQHGEPALFWLLASTYLLPIWAFRYLPTQDGPSHLDNAQILKELGNSTDAYTAYFEIRAELIPNWTSHLIFAALLLVRTRLARRRAALA